MTTGKEHTWGLNSSALASISLAKGVRSSAEPTPSVARAQHVFARPCDVNVDNLAWACFGNWETTCIISGSRASAVAKAQPARGELVLPYAVDATRLHLTMKWVVSFSILSAVRARSRTLLRTQVRDVLRVEGLQP